MAKGTLPESDRAIFREMSRLACVAKLGMYWRSTGLYHYEVADKFNINQARFRQWTSQKAHSGPLFKSHHHLLLAVFYPGYEDKVREIFWVSPAKIIKAYRESLGLSRSAFASQNFVSNHVIRWWEDPEQSSSPSLNLHFVLVRRLLAFAVERYERRLARASKQTKKDKMPILQPESEQ